LRVTLDANHHEASETDAALLRLRQDYWLHYWMVCSTVAFGKRLLLLLPLAASVPNSYPAVHTILCQIELFLWIWLNVVPKMTSSSIQQLENYSTPVEFLAVNVITPAATFVYLAAAVMVPASVWQRFVVNPTTKSFGLGVWSKMLKQEACDSAAHFVTEARVLILPALTVFFCPLLRVYAILYVAYALPLAKSGAAKAAAIPTSPSMDRSAIHWLQFWVLHSVLTMAFSVLSYIIWWIPLFDVAFFCLYSALSVVSAASIEMTYHSWIHQELQSFRILPLGDHQQALPTTHEARLVRLIYWVGEKLKESEHAGSTTLSRDEAEESDATGVAVRFNERGLDDDFAPVEAMLELSDDVAFHKLPPNE
jgi:hypothetical protein